MKKTLQKGFSLVELLVVVAIIGVLAGVGIVGYQSYTESAKEKVAEANFNSVVRFIETELTLLNNGVQDASGALFHTTPAATYSSCGSTAFTRGSTTNGTVAGLKGGIACHFGTQDGGLKFKNPFKSSTTNAVIAINGAGTGAAGNYQKGSILIRTSQAGENGLSTGATATEGTTAGKITVVYVGKNETAVPTLANQSTANGYKTKDLELK
jgi:prepilin-type N-terminal cleavage/methylation domain-containing protein